MADDDPITAFAIPPSKWALSDEDPHADPGPSPRPTPSQVGSPKADASAERAPLLGGDFSPSAPPLPSSHEPYMGTLPSSQEPYAGPLPSGQAPYEGAAKQAPLPPPPPFRDVGPAVIAPSSYSGWCFGICVFNAAAVAMLVCLASGAAGASSASFGGAFGGCYVLYLALCFCSPSGRALRNVMSQRELDAYVHRLRHASPVVEATIQCYHYETRHRRESHTDKDGNRHHRHVRYTERVNTHFARERWAYAWSRDVSGPPVYQPHLAALRVRIKAVQDFTGAGARAAFDAWRESFFWRNARDAYQERSCKMTVPGLEGYVMLQRDEGRGLLSPGWHFAASLCLLGGIYEAAVVGEVPTTKWLLVKQLHA